MSVFCENEIEEIPGVTLAVQHLQELASRMKNNHLSFDETDLENVDIVIEAIQDLVRVCSELHATLETVTIEASVLRYKLKNYPQEIRDEIEHAVKAARDLHSIELNHVTSQRQAIENEITSIEAHLNQLNSENIKNRAAALVQSYATDLESDFLDEFMMLRDMCGTGDQTHCDSVADMLQMLISKNPELDRTKILYEEILLRLNHQLSETKDEQLKLHGIKDKIKGTNQQMADLEDGIVRLNKELVEERALAIQHKQKLQDGINGLTQSLNEQRKINDVTKKEMDTQFLKMSARAKPVTQLQQSTIELEASYKQLKADEERLQQKLDCMVTTVGGIQVDISTIDGSLAQEKVIFFDKRTKMESRIAELDKLAALEVKKKIDLDGKNNLLQSTLSYKMEIRNADTDRLSKLEKVVQQQRASLAELILKVSDLRRDVVDIEQHKMVDLNRSHRAVLDSLNRRADELKEKLTKTSLERIDLDSELDAIDRDLERLQSEARIHEEQCENTLVSSRTEHNKLMHDAIHLRSVLENTQSTINDLQEELKKARDELSCVQSAVAVEVESIEREIESITLACEATTSLIDSRRPDYEILQKDFLEKTSSFEKAKTDLAAMKKTRLNVQKEILSTTAWMEQVADKQVDFRQQLTGASSTSFERLKDSMNELRWLEQRIYTMHCKLERLANENARFDHEITLLDTRLLDIDEQMNYNNSICEKLMMEFDNIRGQLEENWKTGETIEQEVAVRDGTTLEGLDTVRNNADVRQRVVTRITSQLECELATLSEFIDQISSGIV